MTETKENKEIEVTEETVEQVETETPVVENNTENKELPVEPVKTEPTVNPQVTELETTVTTLQTELETVKAENEQLKAKLSEVEGTAKNVATEVTEVKTKAESYEKALQDIVSQKEQSLTDNLKTLMPDNLPVEKKLEWLDKALGVETTVKHEETDKPVITEIGKPTPVENQYTDQSDISATKRMSNVFSQVFKVKPN